MALDGRLGDQEPGGSAEPLTARNGRHPRDRDSGAAADAANGSRADLRAWYRSPATLTS
jgi:hypothetical protein